MRGGKQVSGSVADRVTRCIPRIYLVVALLVSTSLCLLTPPFWVPDEMAHSERELEIAHGQLMAERSPQGVGAPMDSNFIQVASRFGAIENALELRYPIAHRRPDRRVTAAQMDAVSDVHWSGRFIFSTFPNTATYPPPLYLPQTIGWRLGEAAGLTIIRTLIVARLMAALCAAFAGWLALRLCVGERWLLFMYLLLPTLLSLSASCSQDALLFGLAALAMAILSRAIAAHRLLTLPEVLAATLLLAVCIGSRPPYLPLALTLLLPALETAGLGQKRVLAPLAGVAAIAAMLLAWQLAVHPLGVLVSSHAAPALQEQFLRGHPLRGALDLVTGTAREAPALMMKAFEVLGMNDAFPPAAIYALLLLGAAGMGLLAPWNGLERRASRVLLTVILLGVIAGISLAEYIIWTPVGAHSVGGLQSRYYLPLVPFGFLLLGDNLRRLASRETRERYLLLAGAVFVTAVLYTPWVAAHRFYGTSLRAAFMLVLR